MNSAVRNTVKRAAFPLHAIVSAAVGVFAILCVAAPVYAGLIIDPTFDPSLTSADDSAINAAISEIEADITSPNNLTVDIYFNSMNSGLGESLTRTYNETYYDYYNALAAVSTSPVQQTALASLGPAPTDESAGNPVNGNTEIAITSAEGRNLGFDTSAVINSSNGIGITGNGTYDGEVLLNTSITSPPGTLSESTYDLEAVANHEIDEVLGIGGTGSTLGNDDLTGPIGDLDLFRYSAPGVRSYSDVQTTSPYAYFSIDDGATVLSYFNQTQGADYGDWLSNPIPNGFEPQVQDAFGQPGTNPTLGPNELTAFNVIGYELITPEPSTIVLTGLGLALGCGFIRRRLAVVS